MVKLVDFEGGHPDDETLRRFAQGRLDDATLEHVASHLDQCQTCLTTVRSLAVADDTLLDGLRAAGSSGDFEVSVKEDDTSDPTCGAIESQGKYQIIKQLGCGGMGSVYLAEHRVMHRKVAIKVIRKELVSNPEAVLRFQNEVRGAARLAHRNIVTAYDAEQVGDVHFLVMEHVAGESLAQLVRRKGALPVKHCCNFALQIAHGLNHAYEHQMVHRDIKPANLMRTPRGIIKVLDFGLSRILNVESDSALTTTGVMMGTADYVAPEQARDAKMADIRSDLYSLGCTFYFLLAGKPPYQADNKVDKILAHCSEAFPDISVLRNDVPSEVVQIIAKLTSKNPDERYQTPKDLSNDLTPFGKPASSKDESTMVYGATQKQAGQNTFDTHWESNTQVDQPVPMALPLRQTTTQPARKQTATNWKPIALLSTAGLLLIPLIWILVSFMGGLGDRENRGTNNNNQNSQPLGETAPSDERPQVLLVMSASNFWFSDYEPVNRVLRTSNIGLIVTADRAGIANYNPMALDDAPNKRRVKIDKSVHELVQQGITQNIQAVVFIGTDTQEFRGNDQTGRSVRRLLTELRSQDKWITSIGKGSEVPMHFGFYDGIEVCNSRFIDQAVRNSAAQLVDARVLEVSESKVLTAAVWEDAESFAEKLVEILKQQ